MPKLHFCLVLLLTLSSGMPVFAQSPTAPLGSEFQVNTYTTGSQGFPEIAVDPSGNFVIVWSNAYASIQGQRFASDGSFIGDEFQVNDATTVLVLGPFVSMGSNGDFVVVWSALESETDELGGLQGRRFASDGNPTGEQFQVNSYTTGRQYYGKVAMIPDGGFVVAWESSGSAGSDQLAKSIQGRRFASDSSPIGDDFQVNTYTTGIQEGTGVAADADGNFIVTWRSSHSGDSIAGQRYASNGDPVGGQLQINSFTTARQEFPRVGFGPLGDFVVTWENAESSGNDNSSNSVQARRFASNGDPIGDDFQVNTYTTNAQNTPDVTVDGDGDFTFVWRSNSGSVDNSSTSIHARRFTSAGDSVGDQFLVNTYTTGAQDHPAVAADSQGNFVVTWHSNGSDTNDTSILSTKAQRFQVMLRLGDKVFYDMDFDGGQDSFEAGMSGVVVSLFAANGDFLESTETDTEGSFLFERKLGLQGTPESFYLEFEAPAPYFFTTANVGMDDSLDSDVDPSTGETETFEYLSAVDDFTIDAGLIEEILFADSFESGDTTAWSSATP